MQKNNIFLAVLSIFLLLGTASANSITIANASSSTLNTTYITPNATYQLLNYTYSTNVSDNATLSSITWYWNSTQIYNQNLTSLNTTNATLNVSYNSNNFGIFPLTANITDSKNNSVLVNTSINVAQYILPSVSKTIPIDATQNVSTIWNVNVNQGSFALKNITWDFNSNYLINVPFNGANYQTYLFNQSGYYNVVVQVCDINAFCSQSTTNVYISNNTPSTYWLISHATLGLSVNYPNPENMALDFIPNNDTNPIGQVSINWGDGTPIQVYSYTSPITSASYIHLYTALGNYSIYTTTCDTIGNCNQQFIANVSVNQNIVGNIGQSLVNTNSQTPTSATFSAIESWFQTTFGSTLGTLVFYLGAIGGAIIIIIVFIMILLMMFSALLKKYI